MKKVMIIMLALGLTVAASAQKIAVRPGHFRSGVYYRPRTTFVVGGYVPYYRPYYYGYYPYYPYGYYPYYPYPPTYRDSYRPTKLDLKIEDIKNEYADKIRSARRDDSLSRKESRKVVHELKHERDQAISDAEKNYYKQ